MSFEVNLDMDRCRFPTDILLENLAEIFFDSLRQTKDQLRPLPPSSLLPPPPPLPQFIARFHQRSLTDSLSWPSLSAYLNLMMLHVGIFREARHRVVNGTWRRRRRRDQGGGNAFFGQRVKPARNNHQLINICTSSTLPLRPLLFK